MITTSLSISLLSVSSFVNLIWLHLNLCRSVCQPIHLSACPTILSWLRWQFNHPLLPVRLSVCPAVCPALAVLTAPRSHAVAVFCSVMAIGATPALSQPMDRQPFFLTLFFPPTIFFLSEKVYFSRFPSLAAAFNLSFSVICLQLHPPLIARPSCCWEADRKRDLETHRKHKIPLRALLRKPANQTQTPFPTSPCPLCCVCT